MEKEASNMKRRIGILDLERRRHPRFKINLPVDYYRLGAPAGQTGRAHDASEGGVEIYFPEEIPIGEHVKLKLFFSSSQSALKAFEAVAEVVWIDMLSGEGEYRSGLRFIDIPPDDLATLRAFLQSLSQ
jgi:c-di-GMP-binding flagellar brake protein YcgR